MEKQLSDEITSAFIGRKHCGCNRLATKEISKTAHQSKTTTHPQTASRRHSPANARLLRCIMSLAVLLGSAMAAPTITTSVSVLPLVSYQSQQSVPSALAPQASSRGGGASNARVAKFMYALYNYSQQNASSSQLVRKRHSKRHSNWYDDFNSTVLEWQNPCGGQYLPSVRRPKRRNPKKFYNLVKRGAANEFKDLQSKRHIDLKDIQMWSLHNYTYKFLPKLKPNSSIALKRWYRNMQKYVGAFSYLRRVQLKWDHSKSQRESNISQELKDLLISSRNMLCDLEAAVNNTQPLHAKALPLVSRSQMDARLKLRTRRFLERNGHADMEADTIDLLFVKYYYLEFLQTMWKVLRQNTKRMGQVALQPSPVAAGERQFNEVTKHFGSLRASRVPLRDYYGGSETSAATTTTRRTPSAQQQRRLKQPHEKRQQLRLQIRAQMQKQRQPSTAQPPARRANVRRRQ